MRIMAQLSATSLPLRLETPVPDRVTRVPPDRVTLEKSRAMEEALQSAPNARSELVGRAAQIVDNPSYPPQEIIEQISLLLAVNMAPVSANCQCDRFNVQFNCLDNGNQRVLPHPTVRPNSGRCQGKRFRSRPVESW